MNELFSRRHIAAGLAALVALPALSASAQVSSGNGGSAGAGANGGSVVMGGGSTAGCIGANGGLATADASGGSNNDAIIGSGDVIRFDPTPGARCVPGTFAENGRGNIVAFCTVGGFWIN